MFGLELIVSHWCIRTLLYGCPVNMSFLISLVGAGTIPSLVWAPNPVFSNHFEWSFLWSRGVSSHTDANQNSAECLKGSLLQISSVSAHLSPLSCEFSLLSSPLTLSSVCPNKGVCLALPGSSFPEPWSCHFFKAVKWDNCRAHLFVSCPSVCSFSFSNVAITN